MRALTIPPLSSQNGRKPFAVLDAHAGERLNRAVRLLRRGQLRPLYGGKPGTGIAFRAGASAESRLSAETGSTSVSTRAGFAAAL